MSILCAVFFLIMNLLAVLEKTSERRMTNALRNA